MKVQQYAMRSKIVKAGRLKRDVRAGEQVARM